MARILLADDDQGARDLVRRALETEGHTVTMAADGAEALAALEAGNFEVLVADVEMPAIDGIELARRARARHPTLRLVMISGSEQLLDKAKSLAGPATGFLTKPFAIDRIRAEVRTVLGS